MADSKKSNRKPVSLNDSHYRFLQDLSAPPKNQSSFEDEEESMNLGGRRRLCKASAMETQLVVDDDDQIPQFSGITDFDPSSEEEKQTKVKIKGRRLLCKVSSRDKEDAGSVAPVPNEPSFSGITDFDPSSEEKQTKVKIEGRRRLCKVSSRGKENATAVDNSNQPANEIRDILNDLSSRLDLLSIEKKRDIHKVNVADEYSKLVGGGDREKKVDVPEYASADSSFSGTSDPSDSSFEVNKIVGGCIESAVDDYDEVHLLRARGDSFVDKLRKANKYSRGLIENEYEQVGGKLAAGGNSYMSNGEEDEENDLRSESEDDTHATGEWKTKKSTKRQEKNESRRVQGRLRSAGPSFVPILSEEEEDEDDCLVLSGKKVVEGAGRHVGKYKESSDHSSAIDLLDDYTNNSVLEDESSFTLAGPRSTYELPSKIAKMLYPHQRDGLKWLWSLHYQGKGGILGDDMGLGKTMQICGFLAGLFHSRLIKRALVVAPKTLLSHWIKELSTVGLSGETREYFGTSSKARQYELQYILQDKGILLTTYDIVRNNAKSLRGDGYADEESEDGYTWDYMILDEGHLIKNPSTQRAKSLLEIPSAHRIIISGTPIQNNLKEMWTLFNFCCPALLGDYKWFKEHYEHPILHGNDKSASARDKHIGSTVAKELRERIQPYFLRRLKNEVFKEDDSATATLSKKNEMIVWLRLTCCQRQLYEAFLQSELVLSAFDGSPLAALTILKKICDHPLLLTKRAAEDVLEGMDSMLDLEDAGVAEKLAMHVADVAERVEFQEKHDNISCKISFMLSLLDDLIPKGHNILIFSQTRKMLNLIQESLLSNGYKFLRIDGTTKASDRVKIVNDFQEGFGAPIFLLTSQVGGLGLTLTKADRVIVVDPAWNPSTDNQSVDRAYRIGQKKDVLVYRLMTCGTVEEKIYRKQIFKGGLFKTATEHKEQIRYFSQQDLRELFSLPKQGFDISLTQQQLHEEHDHQYKMDEFLEGHVNFLESLGIAGVSHHSLLFSKTARLQVVNIEEEEIRRKRNAFLGSSSSYSIEHNVDGAVHAFNPKDVKLNKKSSSPDSVGKLTESEIKERIKRLSQLLGNKVTVSRLPDQGAKLEKQISELKLELNKMRMEKTTRKEVIDLDDLTGDLQRVLNV
ncbi:protein CHROMATIN REMODELING 24 isoform X2 [Hevea brasiliensis]|uniref:protein CHROMATIN REMODELING 24 isoform X2 n=1 Tax=Hevea brasiliensis TaxID=3981 RepID=UPI0025DEC853|nr:protein CHROMATIN REMODELING 24 isoform X2 [Hevea brasiliensis]